MSSEQIWTRRDFVGAAAVGTGAALLAGCDLGGSSSKGGSSTSSAGRTPKRGGTLRFGTSDGSSNDSTDTLPADNTWTNTLICSSLYDTLMAFNPTQPSKFVNRLAEEVTPAADFSHWTVRVREAEFHDGKPVTADDVIYSLKRFLAPESSAAAKGLLTSIDPSRLQKLDKRTVRINLHYPDADLIPIGFSWESSSIVPVGFDPKKPIGSGPFRLKSFAPGQRTVMSRNDNYFQSGKPYLDELQIVGFADPGTTRITALQGGEIDAADRVPFSLVPILEDHSNVKAVLSPSHSFHTWEMRTDIAPFDDVRVRQAIKLIANRQQIVDQVFRGSRFARVGNDLGGFGDVYYDDSIPQRQQDIEQAKSLLKQAGREGLTVELAVSATAPGVVETAQVLAENAEAAGVTIKVKNIADAATYFAKYYFQAPFKFDYFQTQTVPMIIVQTLLPASHYNLSKYNDPQFIRLTTQARSAPDLAKRKELYAEAQKILWNEGPYGVFAFYHVVDALSTKFAGETVDVWGGGLPRNQVQNLYQT